jgi:excisionase family DNA binding protein
MGSRAVNQDLDSQVAADLLGVSCRYMVRLLDEGKLPFYGTGIHRRVNLDDLMAYKTERDNGRREALSAMAREEVEAGTYDVIVLPEG